MRGYASDALRRLGRGNIVTVQEGSWHLHGMRNALAVPLMTTMVTIVMMAAQQSAELKSNRITGWCHKNQSVIGAFLG